MKTQKHAQSDQRFRIFLTFFDFDFAMIFSSLSDRDLCRGLRFWCAGDLLRLRSRDSTFFNWLVKSYVTDFFTDFVVVISRRGSAAYFLILERIFYTEKKGWNLPLQVLLRELGGFFPDNRSRSVLRRRIRSIYRRLCMIVYVFWLFQIASIFREICRNRNLKKHQIFCQNKNWILFDLL
jgi:hypothetical protein